MQPTVTTSTPIVFIPQRIQIDRGIPLPPKTRLGRHGSYGKYVTYPWRDMAIGDSFAVPFEGDVLRAQIKMTSSITDRQRRHPGPRYALRALVEDGRYVIRVWRTA